MNKPAIDDVTGCAHIRNYHTPIGTYRGCSVCEAGICDHASQNEYVEEENVSYCWNCGVCFDHSDDDPREDER